MKQTKTREEEMQCMKCKEYFKECICFKSEGFIPKIWYCDRCYGFQEGRRQALADVEKIIDKFDIEEFNQIDNPLKIDNEWKKELKSSLKELGK